jgi:hypothetical protein
MIWLTLRQHRVQIAGLLVIAVLLAIGMTLAADYAARLRVELSVDSCGPFTSANCAQLDNEWRRRTGPLNYLFYSLYVLPGLVASYVGGPLFAIELERGTHRLAWTQGIGRVRWAAVKLGVVLLVALASAIIVAPFGGLQRVFLGQTPTRPFETFEIEGLALVSYFVFGLMAGALVGAWSRRIITGMFVGLLIFGAVRVGVHNLRPMYQEPATVPWPSISRFESATNNAPPGAWILGIKGFDLNGRPVPNERLNSLTQEYIRTSGGFTTATSNDTTFLLERGVVRRLAFQPADRFWTFQAIEAAIFTCLAALFALLTLWRVQTRDA